MNFSRDVVDAAPADRLALIELSRDERRNEWTFGAVAGHAAAFAAVLQARGVGRGDVVMTVLGNRPEWIIAVVACFRIGAVVLPCSEQLRANDLRMRIDTSDPAAIVIDERNCRQVEATGIDGAGIPVLVLPDSSLMVGPPAPAVDLGAEDPCLITFTSGTSGEPKAVVHAQRYLFAQRLQARHWLGARSGDLVWCTAASGWSKSARNVFIAPWLMGNTALLHDARFDPGQRLEILARERVNVLCMAPTEYRIVAGRNRIARFPDLRRLLAAGEALDPETFHTWREAAGIAILDGYGQTETGQLTAMPDDSEPRPGSMGIPLPGVRLRVDNGELVADPATVPTFFLRYLGQEPHQGPWRTGDRVHQDDDGYLYFASRADDVIISGGYRIGPFEVDSALLGHPGVIEAAAIGVPDADRGSVVVLGDGYGASDRLARELQNHVKSQTAPYKYPRLVEFVSELPKTSSGKVKRTLLRQAYGQPGRSMTDELERLALAHDP